MPGSVTVGYGKDYATITAGVAAVDAAGTVTVYAQNASGDRVYVEAFTITKALTLQSDQITKKIIIAGTDGGSPSAVIQLTQTSGTTTINDCILWNKNTGNLSTYGIDTTATGSAFIINRCVFANLTRGIEPYHGTSSFTCNNCIFISCNYGLVTGSNASNACTLNYCGFYVCSAASIYTDSNVSVTLNNNLFYLCGAFVGSSYSGANNATTASSGLPATNAIYDLTETQLAPAYLILTNGDDLRGTFTGYFVVDGQGSTLENAGDATLCASITIDINNRARSASTSNIGAVEGFTGFAGSASSAYTFS